MIHRTTGHGNLCFRASHKYMINVESVIIFGSYLRQNIYHICAIMCPNVQFHPNM